MALELEDGTAKDDANSFVSANTLVPYAATRGVTMTTQQAEIHLTRAWDYLNLFEAELKGSRKSETQSGIYPRNGVYLTADSEEYPNNLIPSQVKFAQMAAALASFDGLSLTPNVSAGPQLKRKDNPAIKREWFEGAGNSMPTLPAVDSWLAVLKDREAVGSLAFADVVRG